jgi:rod shape-determining protein MreC
VAPPTSARPGWSRRAQYSLFFSFLAAIGLLLAGLGLLALNVAKPQLFAPVRGVALDVTAPVTGLLRSIGDTVGGLVSGAGNYWDAARQNGRLREENVGLRRQALQARAILLENAQLKAALALREKSSVAVATGRIVGSSLESERRFAILSAGSGDGVAVGMPVRAADGLVGRIVDVGATAARVLLVSDRANIVPARLLRGGQAVIATGRGDGTVDVRPLEVGRNPFRRGDVIATSGTGGLYPPNVPIARIIRLDDDGAIAVPLADPARASFAIVEQPFNENALPPPAPEEAAR